MVDEETEPIDLAAINPELAERIDVFLTDPSTGVRRERPKRRIESGDDGQVN